MSGAARNRGGFTLIELMLVVAIIGILASIAIPAFLTYQSRTRRSEAYANVAAIAQLQKGYFSEYDAYTEVPVSQPGGGAPTPHRRPWTPAASDAFGVVGFEPEGPVYHDYDVNMCPGSDCFTVTAYGDTDGDGLLSMVQYAQPSAAGVTVPSLLFPALGIPIDIAGRLQLNEVAVNHAADEY